MTVNVPKISLKKIVMSRPAFALTDSQARSISIRTAELELSFPLDPRNHRPFVRAFLRAVQDATGNLYSPAIYHRLLKAYAPDRRPSTATLATEKQALALEAIAQRTKSAAIDGINVAPQTIDNLDNVQAAVTEAVEACLARIARGTGHADSAQTNFYAARLRDAEAQLRESRAECVRLTSELSVANESSRLSAKHAADAATSLTEQIAAVAMLTAELADIRKFALGSIDEARGEARAWKDRCISVEAQRQRDMFLLETFRQQAYRNGAAIPASLAKDNSK